MMSRCSKIFCTYVDDMLCSLTSRPSLIALTEMVSNYHQPINCHSQITVTALFYDKKNWHTVQKIYNRTPKAVQNVPINYSQPGLCCIYCWRLHKIYSFRRFGFIVFHKIQFLFTSGGKKHQKHDTHLTPCCLMGSETVCKRHYFTFCQWQFSRASCSVGIFILPFIHIIWVFQCYSNTSPVQYSKEQKHISTNQDVNKALSVEYWKISLQLQLKMAVLWQTEKSENEP